MVWLSAHDHTYAYHSTSIYSASSVFLLMYKYSGTDKVWRQKRAALVWIAPYCGASPHQRSIHMYQVIPDRRNIYMIFLHWNLWLLNISMCSKWGGGGGLGCIWEGIIVCTLKVMLLVQYNVCQQMSCHGNTWDDVVTLDMHTRIRPADWCAAARSLPADRKPVRLVWQLALSDHQERTYLWMWELTVDYVKC